MSKPSRNILQKQNSKTYLEQSLDMISSPRQAPITIYCGPKAELSTLSKADLEIAERLHHLRLHDMENLPTDEEMCKRLAHLKGLPEDHYLKSSTSAYHKQDTRTEGEKTEDLLSQVMEEVTLESRLPKPDNELKTRLAKLRGSEYHMPSSSEYHMPSSSSLVMDSSVQQPPSSDQYQSLQTTQKLMQSVSEQYSAEAEASLKELNADPEIAKIIADAMKKKKKKRHPPSPGGSSSGEKISNSDDSDVDIDIGKTTDGETEQMEVQRIVDMYTKRAQKKKKRNIPEDTEELSSGSPVTSDDELMSDSDDVLSD